MRGMAATLVTLGLVIAACGEDDDEPVGTEAASDPAPTDPPTTTAPPPTEPPSTEPPATEPPPTDPPATDPPSTEPQPTEPPATDPAATQSVELNFIALDGTGDLTGLESDQAPPGPLFPELDILSCEGVGNEVQINLAGPIFPSFLDVEIGAAQIAFSDTSGTLIATAIAQYDTETEDFDLLMNGDPSYTIESWELLPSEDGFRFEFRVPPSERELRDIEEVRRIAVECYIRYTTFGIENLNEDVTRAVWIQCREAADFVESLGCPPAEFDGG